MKRSVKSSGHVSLSTIAIAAIIGLAVLFGGGCVDDEIGDGDTNEVVGTSEEELRAWCSNWVDADSGHESLLYCEGGQTYQARICFVFSGGWVDEAFTMNRCH